MDHKAGSIHSNGERWPSSLPMDPSIGFMAPLATRCAITG
ncbi:hypothetical protein SynMINOS11_01532 [Synechococcus sp. Minos11]|nr:hypothetical protein SynMINOS11_01532 [Synechococcus sp. Minos11]